MADNPTYEQLLQEMQALQAKYAGVEELLRKVLTPTGIGSSQFPMAAGKMSVQSLLYDVATTKTFDTAEIGERYWDPDARTTSLKISNSSAIQDGQEIQRRCRNSTGAQITNGTMVYVTGATGNRPTIDKIASSSDNSKGTLGMTTEDIANNADGQVTLVGTAREVPIGALAEGAAVYLDATTPGAITGTSPTGDNYVIRVGTVTRKSGTTGDVDIDIRFFGRYDVLYDTKYWEDLRVPLAQTKLGATAKPDYDFTNNGLLFPQNDATEIAYFIAQIPHEALLSSTLKAHIHWQQSAATAVTWGLDYKIFANNTAVPAAWTTLTSSTGSFTYSSGNLAQITALGDITIPDSTSAILLGKLYRNDNTTTGDVLAWEIDFHYQIDRPGSRQEYVK